MIPISEDQVPRDTDAERAVLGSILDAGVKALALVQSEEIDLRSDDFFNGAHQMIFKAALCVRDVRRQVDLFTVKAYLEEQDQLEVVGGPAYLASLVDPLVRSTNVEDHAKIVKRRARERKKVEDAIRTLTDNLRSPSSETSGDDPVQALLLDAGIFDLRLDSRPAIIEAALRKLAASVSGMDQLSRVNVRRTTVVVLEKVGIKKPAALVDAALGTKQEPDEVQGRPLTFQNPEPWPEPVDGCLLLKEISDVFNAYMVLPRGAGVILALWTLHAHTHDTAEFSPILILKSATMQSGKSRTLTILDALVPKSLLASDLSAPVLFRVVEKYRPTLLLDEGDSWIKRTDDFRGLLNSGHGRSGARVLRCVGDDHEPEEFSTWCPKAIALIGDPPGTVLDRAIVIQMRRKAPNEKVRPLRLGRLHKELEPLRRRAARWAQDNFEGLRHADPEVPEALDDRAADNWRPLLAIAEACGWKDDALDVALTLNESVDKGDRDKRVMLLADIRDFFRERDTTRLSSQEIADHLGGLEDRPWADYRHGKPIQPTHVASLLKPFGIRPKLTRMGPSVSRGYHLDDFTDTFSRYRLDDPLQALQDAAGAGFGEVAGPLQPFEGNALEIGGNGRQDGVVTVVTVQGAPRGGEDGPAVLNFPIPVEKVVATSTAGR